MHSSTRKGLARELDVLSVVALLWIASALQVAWTLLHRDVFGVVSTLALAVVLSVPAAVGARALRRLVSATNRR